MNKGFVKAKTGATLNCHGTSAPACGLICHSIRSGSKPHLCIPFGFILMHQPGSHIRRKANTRTFFFSSASHFTKDEEFHLMVGWCTDEFAILEKKDAASLGHLLAARPPPAHRSVAYIKEYVYRLSQGRMRMKTKVNRQHKPIRIYLAVQNRDSHTHAKTAAFGGCLSFYVTSRTCCVARPQTRTHATTATLGECLFT